MEEEKNIFSLDDTSDLPADIRDELVVNKRDEFEKRMIDLFKLAGRDLSIDEIQTGYYRKYGEAKKRTQITAKLYNMSRSKSPAIESVPKKKGIYRLKQEFATAEEISDLLS